MENVVAKFYNAFSNLDSETMCSCYHDNIVFEDPAFGILRGDKAKAMWQMLCASQKGKDFKVIASNIKADETSGAAHWEAFYKFSKTGRSVHNKIDAQFDLKDGLILKHTDTFNLHKWAKQAMGFKGFIIGHTRYFKTKLQSQTNYLLDKFIEEKKLSP
ncbi:nuclear transport factor 2 family protein [Winogradskyella flava]|uniref:Nuclear transport factor 2 family protein n=1 Tax=Winogradskyella flava TaxID=1884876 RepID=A0A842IU27_9FLAO|nr:nuclear transport factor 2 family protein [Winogradskyella flava]MBC2844887.1 nuclear transport factor 2 family protein [Winogradskyella flava]